MAFAAGYTHGTPTDRHSYLAKDFIIDEYQLLQARIVGADAVLLIAACLTQEECATLTAQAHALGLEVLLEIHTFSELAYVNADVDMVASTTVISAHSSPM